MVRHSHTFLTSSWLPNTLRIGCNGHSIHSNPNYCTRDYTTQSVVTTYTITTLHHVLNATLLLRHSRLHLHPMPPLHLLLQHLINHPLLLQHPTAPKSLTQHFNSVHASTSPRDILHLQLRWAQRLIQFLPDLRFLFVEMIGRNERGWSGDGRGGICGPRSDGAEGRGLIALRGGRAYGS